tara:strand:+ start:987 stop:1751 length:765 start_codon:yes stop_codon:yes gene_type:complete
MRETVVFLSNRKYLTRFADTLNQLRSNGKYAGSVLLVIGDDLLDQKSGLESKYQIKIVHFPDITFSPEFMKYFNTLEREGHWKNKIFQYHKFYLFDPYFKTNYDKIIYIDCGMHINLPIAKMFELFSAGKILADYDYRVHPKRFHKSLESQFCKNYPEEFQALESAYDLTKWHFQTTFMIYDTKIIKDDTASQMIELTKRYPIAMTNDQAIVALYYTVIEPCWEQIEIGDETTYYYSYKFTDQKKPTVISKWNR